jgi:hypothetical protein
MRLLFALWVCAASLRADAQPDPLATTAAQAHYDAGRTYFEQNDLRRALTEFRAAQHDDDRPALDYNIALCWEGLGDAARAAAHLRRFVARATGPVDNAALQARIAALEARTGELELRSRTPAIGVSIDDEPLEGTVVRLTAGRHRVSATQAGHYHRVTEVEVLAGQRRIVEIAALDAPGPTDEDRRRRRRALAIGLGVAGGVIVVAAAVTLGVVLSGQARDAYVGNLGPIVVSP